MNLQVDGPLPVNEVAFSKNEITDENNDILNSNATTNGNINGTNANINFDTAGVKNYNENPGMKEHKPPQQPKYNFDVVVSDSIARNSKQLLLAHIYDYLLTHKHLETAKQFLKEADVPLLTGNSNVADMFSSAGNVKPTHIKTEGSEHSLNSMSNTSNQQNNNNSDKVETESDNLPLTSKSRMSSFSQNDLNPRELLATKMLMSAKDTFLLEWWEYFSTMYDFLNASDIEDLRRFENSKQERIFPLVPQSNPTSLSNNNFGSSSSNSNLNTFNTVSYNNTDLLPSENSDIPSNGNNNDINTNRNNFNQYKLQQLQQQQVRKQLQLPNHGVNQKAENNSQLGMSMNNLRNMQNGNLSSPELYMQLQQRAQQQNPNTNSNGISYDRSSNNMGTPQAISNELNNMINLEEHMRLQRQLNQKTQDEFNDANVQKKNNLTNENNSNSNMVHKDMMKILKQQQVLQQKNNKSSSSQQPEGNGKYINDANNSKTGNFDANVLDNNSNNTNIQNQYMFMMMQMMMMSKNNQQGIPAQQQLSPQQLQSPTRQMQMRQHFEDQMENINSLNNNSKNNVINNSKSNPNINNKSSLNKGTFSPEKNLTQKSNLSSASTVNTPITKGKPSKSKVIPSKKKQASETAKRLRKKADISRSATPSNGTKFINENNNVITGDSPYHAKDNNSSSTHLVNFPIMKFNNKVPNSSNSNVNSNNSNNSPSISGEGTGSNHNKSLTGINLHVDSNDDDLNSQKKKKRRKSKNTLSADPPSVSSFSEPNIIEGLTGNENLLATASIKENFGTIIENVCGTDSNIDFDLNMHSNSNVLNNDLSLNIDFMNFSNNPMNMEDFQLFEKDNFPNDLMDN